MKKHSVNIHGHQTSITLEDEFWNALKNTAQKRGLSLNKLIAEIDDNRTRNGNKHNLSSAIRLYILRELTAPKTP
ncbi:MAG: ribbon-helix-helix domain-containing protein [Alphaproteobacteria bacterium]